jgi:hypothetical protein
LLSSTKKTKLASKETKPESSQLNTITELCNQAISLGYWNIYEYSYKTIQEISLTKPQSEKKRPLQGSIPKPCDTWEYKWGSNDAAMYGPFDTHSMNAWTQQVRHALYYEKGYLNVLFILELFRKRTLASKNQRQTQRF